MWDLHFEDKMALPEDSRASHAGIGFRTSQLLTFGGNNIRKGDENFEINRVVHRGCELTKYNNRRPL